MKKFMKNKKLLTILAMVLMVSLVVGMGAMTYAKYVSNYDGGSGTATAAKWGFVVTANTDNLFGTQYKSDDSDTYATVTETGDVVVKAEATLLKTYKQNSTLCYTTTYPTPFEHTQKREYYRADIHVPVKLLILLQNGQVKNIEATTKNISGRGMCFVSVEPEIPNYHSITINFTLNGRFFVVTGDYVHSTPVKYKNATLYIHAFKFISIEVEDINFIVKECFLHQLKQKKVT